MKIFSTLNVRQVKRNSYWLFLSFFLSLDAYGQQVHHFTKGLVATGTYRYGREALYMDQVAYNLYNKTMKTPEAGGILGTDEKGQPIKWQPVTVDSLNRFRSRSRGMRNGYLYLTYTSTQEKNALLNIKGNSAVIFNGAPHTGDPYNSGWMYVPVRLKKGLNELYVRGQQVTADLIFPEKQVLLNMEDPTLPNLVLGDKNTMLQGALVIINVTDKALKRLQIKSLLAGKEVHSDLAVIPAMSTRKVIFKINGDNIRQTGQHECRLILQDNGKTLDEKKIEIEAVAPTAKYMNTFVSEIDGSLQYYAVAPQAGGTASPGAALFFSVHGAGVEAIGQARAYQAKDWGTLVAPTNRRPRGFNWEDWGRLDALEVLNIAKTKFRPDPKRVYLTGHSMGGHGTWFLGATYPDMWAGIGPCSGYPTLKGYGSADGLIPDSSASIIGKMLLRASNPSDVLKLANNYKALGIYLLHGDEDKVVSVKYARQMRALLGRFHPDFSYYEYPGGSHWFGDENVDWKPMFEYFKWHKLAPDSAVQTIDFTTASPGISSSYRWVSVQQQTHPLQFSRLQLTKDKKAGTIRGTTSNVRLMTLDLGGFGNNAPVTITLDSLNPIKYTTVSAQDSLFLLRSQDKWTVVNKPGLAQKGSHRYGTFKEPFNKLMVYVYGTKGNKEENNWSWNKARYDAETWYYRGNGAVDIIADKDFSVSKYKGRNVILYGNASTNAAWNTLLKDCPIQVDRKVIKVGEEVLKGDDLGAYFIWPIQNSTFNSVAVISGSGLKGMHAATANQYFAGGSGFPDFMIFGLDMLLSGERGVRMAGFYDQEWKLSTSNFVQSALISK
jgi:dienelactone hydrolase